MTTRNIIKYREATSIDVDFMSEILVDAAFASGVEMHAREISSHPDAYQYIEGFPQGADVGIVAESAEGLLVGAAWIRLLSTDVHAVHKHLPELTMGVVAAYRRAGIGARLMEELYRAASAKGISEISLGVHKDNKDAVRLYKKKRWIEEGSFVEYIMMHRKIDG